MSCCCQPFIPIKGQLFAIISGNHYFIPQNVMLEDLVYLVVVSYLSADLGHPLAYGLIRFVFIVQAAEKPVAGAGYLGWVEGQVLLFCHLDGN